MLMSCSSLTMKYSLLLLLLIPSEATQACTAAEYSSMEVEYENCVKDYESILTTSNMDRQGLNKILTASNIDKQDLNNILTTSNMDKQDLNNILTASNIEKQYINNILTASNMDKKDLNNILTASNNDKQDLTNILTASNMDKKDLNNILTASNMDKQDLNNILTASNMEKQDLNSILPASNKDKQDLTNILTASNMEKQDLNKILKQDNSIVTASNMNKQDLTSILTASNKDEKDLTNILTASNKDIQDLSNIVSVTKVETGRLICDTIDEAAKVCGQLLDKCHGQEQVHAREHDLVQRLVLIGGSNGLDCSMVIPNRYQNEKTYIQDNVEDNTDYDEMTNENDNKTDMTYYSSDYYEYVDIDVDHYGEKMCSEAALYQQMDHCSQQMSTNFEIKIWNVFDSSLITKSACKALHLIGTACTMELDFCFSQIDASEIRSTHVEYWKSILENVIQNVTGNHLSLEDCHMEYKEDNYEQSKEKSNEVNKVWLPNDQCSESNMRIAEDNIDNCTREVATRAFSKMYKTADSIIISEILCKAKTAIDRDCAAPLENCFSNKHIDWLIKPVKTYLNALAASKDKTHSLQNCQGYVDINEKNYFQDTIKEERNKLHFDMDGSDERTDHSTPDIRYALNDEDTSFHKEGTTGNDKSRNDEDDCSNVAEESLYERMENCSHIASLQVHFDIGDFNDPNKLTNIACDALNTIGTNCVRHMRDCLSKTDVDEIRNIQIEEWKIFIIEIIESKNGIKLSLENCHGLVREYYNQNGDGSKPGQNFEVIKNQDNVQEKSDKDLKEVTNNSQNLGAHQDEICSTEILYEKMDKCSRNIAKKVWIDVENDPLNSAKISNVVCRALTDISTTCVNILSNCFTSKDLNDMKSIQIKQWKKYFIRGIELPLDNCHSLTKENIDRNVEDKGNNKNYSKNESLEPTQAGKDILKIENIYKEKLTKNSQETKNNVENFDYPENDTCSEKILYKIMDNCSRQIAINVWTDTKDELNSTRVSNLICEAITEISTCVDILGNCFATEEVQEMKSIQVNQWRRYFMRNTARRGIDGRSLNNCSPSSELNIQGVK